MGHSQGGHAALGAAQYASRAQLDYKGTVAVAPASNLGSILLNGELEAASASVYEKAIYAQLDAFTALVVAGIRNTHPDFHYVQVFTESTARIAQDAEGFVMNLYLRILTLLCKFILQLMGKH